MACLIVGSGWYTNKCGRCVSSASDGTDDGMDECGECIVGSSPGRRKDCSKCGEERDNCGICRRRSDSEWNSCG